LEVIIAATAVREQVAADYGAALVVTVLGTGRALEISEILFLELVGGGEDTLAFFLSLFFISNQSESNFFGLWYINLHLNIRRES